MTTPETIAVAGNTGVTIEYNSSKKIGKLVVVNVRFTPTADIAQWGTIFTGLPVPVSSAPSGNGVVALASNTGVNVTVAAQTGYVIAGESIPKNVMYIVSGCYVCN